MQSTRNQSKLITNIMIIAVLAFLAVACYKPIDDVQLPSKWEPEMALPVGSSDFTVSNTFLNRIYNPGADTIPAFFEDSLYYIDSMEIQMFSILPFELKSMVENTSFIRKVTFRVNIDNSFPYETLLQLYILDSKHQIADSILAEDQRIYVPGQKQMDVPFEWSRVQKIIDMESIRVKSGIIIDTIDTTKLSSAYHVKVQVGARIEFMINPDSTFNK